MEKNKDSVMNPTSVITILQTINSIALTINGIIDAIEYLKNGNPDAIDIEKLRLQLLNLPDLPELKNDLDG